MVKTIEPFPLYDSKVLSNPHKNTISPVDCCKNNLSKSSFADQNVVYDKISHSYDCTTSYPIDSVVFK